MTSDTNTVPYGLGCCDKDGYPLCDDIPFVTDGPARVRIFDPEASPSFASEDGWPRRIIVSNSVHEVTHLRFINGYVPRESDGKYATVNTEQGQRLHVKSDTIVIEVGAIQRHGKIIAARAFDAFSKYNTTGVPVPASKTTRAKETAKTIDIGCQKAGTIVNDKTYGIKNVIFMTYESAIYNAIPKLDDWYRNGFPKKFEGGLEAMDLMFLITNIVKLEACGANVRFWLVQPEFVLAPHMLAIDAFDKSEGILPSASCGDCPNCMTGTQSRQITFARTGHGECPCPPCAAITAKYGHLKKGDTFPFSNNAGVQVELIMQVDAGSTEDLNKVELGKLFKRPGDPTEEAAGHTSGEGLRSLEHDESESMDN